MQVTSLYPKVLLANQTDIIIASLRCTPNPQYFNESDSVSSFARPTKYSGLAPTISLRSLQVPLPLFDVQFTQLRLAVYL